MTLAETIMRDLYLFHGCREIKKVTAIENIPIGAEWLTNDKKGSNYHQVIIILGRECRDCCDEMANLKIIQTIDNQAKHDDVVVYSDGYVM